MSEASGVTTRTGHARRSTDFRADRILPPVMRAGSGILDRYRELPQRVVVVPGEAGTARHDTNLRP